MWFCNEYNRMKTQNLYVGILTLLSPKMKGIGPAFIHKNVVSIDFFEFDPRQLHLLEALRTLRLLHYSAWLAMRWHDPAFPLAFPWFNTVRYWQDRILELREQVALMDEAPLWQL